jgi:hypothetical protein
VSYGATHPARLRPFAGPKESIPVEIDFQRWLTPPTSRTPAKRPPTEFAPARHSAANCTPLVAHSVRSDPSTDGRGRSHDRAQAAPAVDTGPPRNSGSTARTGKQGLSANLVRDPVLANLEFLRGFLVTDRTPLPSYPRNSRLGATPPVVLRQEQSGDDQRVRAGGLGYLPSVTEQAGREREIT